MTTLDVSVVVYQPDLKQLSTTLTTLRNALMMSVRHGKLDSASLWLVDNGTNAVCKQGLEDIYRSCCHTDMPLRCHLMTGHGNIGYGCGHNLAIRQADGDWHLVLNPDVEIHPQAITQAVDFMLQHPDVGLLAPHAEDRHGHPLYLTKRYPTVLDLALRGFAPAWIRRLFRRRLDHYEMRDVSNVERAQDVPIISGCFMFFRRDTLQAIGGFDDDFFLYFEDFDISLRASRKGRVVYVPAIRIVHHGGHAAKKGWQHIRLFAASMVHFYRKHGWKLF